MSWKSSQYDENPFSDNVNLLNNNSQHSNAGGGYTPPPLPAVNNSPPPPWLQNNNAPSAVPAATATAAATPTDPAALDPAVPKMILYTRVLNLALSVCMIITSLLAMLTTQSATTGVLACYVVVFACLLCCFETHLKQVSKIIALNFGFLYSAKSRSAFMVFIGTIMFSFSLFGKVIGLCMLANACFNIFILFQYPQFDDAQRNQAQAEIKDFLAANPAFQQQVVDAGFKVGFDFFKSNPEMARQAGQAAFSAATSQHSSTDGRGSYTTV